MHLEREGLSMDAAGLALDFRADVCRGRHLLYLARGARWPTTQQGMLQPWFAELLNVFRSAIYAVCRTGTRRGEIRVVSRASSVTCGVCAGTEQPKSQMRHVERQSIRRASTGSMRHARDVGHSVARVETTSRIAATATGATGSRHEIVDNTPSARIAAIGSAAATPMRVPVRVSASDCRRTPSAIFPGCAPRAM